MFAIFTVALSGACAPIPVAGNASTQARESPAASRLTIGDILPYAAAARA